MGRNQGYAIRRLCEGTGHRVGAGWCLKMASCLLD